jgi:hypothetical protein
MRLLFEPQFAAPTTVAGSIAHGGRLWLNRDAQRAEVHFTLPVAEENNHG